MNIWTYGCIYVWINGWMAHTYILAAAPGDLGWIWMDMGGYRKIWLDMAVYSWICLDMAGYVWIWLVKLVIFGQAKIHYKTGDFFIVFDKRKNVTKSLGSFIRCIDLGSFGG